MTPSVIEVLAVSEEELLKLRAEGQRLFLEVAERHGWHAGPIVTVIASALGHAVGSIPNPGAGWYRGAAGVCTDVAEKWEREMQEDGE